MDVIYFEKSKAKALNPITQKIIENPDTGNRFALTHDKLTVVLRDQPSHHYTIDLFQLTLLIEADEDSFKAININNPNNSNN